MALSRPPGLAAQCLRDCGTNYYRRLFRYHGAFSLGATLHFCVHQGALGKEAQASPEVRGRLAQMRDGLAAWLDRLPFDRGESSLELSPDYEPSYFALITSATTTPYWHNRRARLDGRWDEYPRDVAVLMVSGWYAQPRRGQLRQAARAGPPASRSRST